MMFDESLAELEAAAKEASVDEWCEEGSVAVSPETVQAAREFLSKLDPSLPYPSVGAGQDGDIHFDWTPENRRRLGAQIGANRRIPWAILLPDFSEHGVLDLGERMPEQIHDMIRKVHYGTTET